MTSRTRLSWQLKYVALVLIWGSSFLLMKVGLDGLHPLQIAALRLVCGALVVTGLLYASGGRLPTGMRVWAHLLACGFFLGALPFTLFAASETRIPSALAGIGNATTPIATVLATIALLPGHRATRRQVLAVVVGFLGVVVIMQPWALTGRPDLAGFAMALGGGASYGVGWTYNRRFLADADLGGLAQPAAALVCGAALVLPALLIWAAGRPAGVGAITAYDPRGHAWWLPLTCIVVLGIIGTGFAYTLQFDVVRAAGPLVGSSITYLIPVVSILLGVLVLQEDLTAWALLGFVIVLAAAMVINSRK